MEGTKTRRMYSIALLYLKDTVLKDLEFRDGEVAVSEHWHFCNLNPLNSEDVAV